jgi:TonB family protein
MPIRITPDDVQKPQGPTDPDFDSGRRTAVAEEIPAQTGSGSDEGDPQSEAGRTNGAGGRGPAVRGSRWIDYETHELLEVIGQLEDERRWARLREGVLWAILVHIAILFALFLIPRYVLKMRPIVETPNNKDFTYLDSPFVPKAKPVAPLTHAPQIDRKTLDELKQQSQTPPAPEQAAPPPPVQQQPVQQQPQPASPIPPNPQSQSQMEAPRPAAVPARPNFDQLARNNGNLADQLQQDMRDSARSHGGESGQAPITGGLPLHPGAGGGVTIISPTNGVDFSAWLAAWHYETERTWDPLIPDEVNPPINKQGQVMIEFTVLPNGRLMDGSVHLVGRSGDTALDRAAWGALTGSSYPPLPRDFHGPYLTLQAWFLYNLQPPQ